MDAEFPAPKKLGVSMTRWRLSEILQYEAERTGEPVPRIDPADERWLTVGEVADRFAASVPTIWRWTANSRANKREVAEA